METTKKRSVQKMLEEVTKDVVDNVLEEFQAVVKPSPLEGNYGVYSDIMNDGDKASAVRCKNCGHTFIKNDYSSKATCPCCNETISLIKAGGRFHLGRRTYWSRRDDMSSYLFAKKMSDFYLLIQIERDYTQELDENDFFEFDKNLFMK